MLDLLSASEIWQLAGLYNGSDSGVLQALANLQGTYDSAADAVGTASTGTASALGAV